MNHEEGGNADGTAERHRIAFVYRIDGDVRFISHRDTLRMFQRALARAGLPLRYSGGFNPQPRLTIPLPRPVGVGSDAECLIVEFTRPLGPEAAADQLRRQLPSGVTLVASRRLAPGERLVPEAARYRLAAREAAPTELAARVRGVLQSDVVQVERQEHKTHRVRTIDVRACLADLRVVGDAVEFDIRVQEDGTARPAEVAQVLGFEPGSINHRIRRMEIRWR